MTTPPANINFDPQSGRYDGVTLPDLQDVWDTTADAHQLQDGPLDAEVRAAGTVVAALVRYGAALGVGEAMAAAIRRELPAEGGTYTDGLAAGRRAGLERAAEIARAELRRLEQHADALVQLGASRVIAAIRAELSADPTPAEPESLICYCREEPGDEDCPIHTPEVSQ